MPEHPRMDLQKNLEPRIRCHHEYHGLRPSQLNRLLQRTLRTHPTRFRTQPRNQSQHLRTNRCQQTHQRQRHRLAPSLLPTTTQNHSQRNPNQDHSQVLLTGSEQQQSSLPAFHPHPGNLVVVWPELGLAFFSPVVQHLLDDFNIFHILPGVDRKAVHLKLQHFQQHNPRLLPLTLQINILQLKKERTLSLQPFLRSSSYPPTKHLENHLRRWQILL